MALKLVNNLLAGFSRCHRVLVAPALNGTRAKLQPYLRTTKSGVKYEEARFNHFSSRTSIERQPTKLTIDIAVNVSILL